jgi:hypothetical protein
MTVTVIHNLYDYVANCRKPKRRLAVRYNRPLTRSNNTHHVLTTELM